MRQSGSSNEWRVCKDGSTFQNKIAVQLQDDNNYYRFMTSPLLFQGGSCTDWRKLDFTYLKSGETAGVRALISSPYNCTENACQYSSGYLSIRNSCR
jgi:hypothetical protein